MAITSTPAAWEGHLSAVVGLGLSIGGMSLRFLRVILGEVTGLLEELLTSRLRRGAVGGAVGGAKEDDGRGLTVFRER